MKDNPRSVVKRYALALAELCNAKQLESEIHSVDKLIAKLGKFPKLKKMLCNKYISHKMKHLILHDVVNDLKLSDNMLGLLGLMITHDRLNLLPQLHDSLNSIHNKNQSIMPVEVVVANDNISAEIQDELADLLAKKFDKKIKLLVRQDKNIIGGLKLRTESLLYDATVLSTLGKLRSNILK